MCIYVYVCMCIKIHKYINILCIYHLYLYYFLRIFTSFIHFIKKKSSYETADVSFIEVFNIKWQSHMQPNKVQHYMMPVLYLPLKVILFLPLNLTQEFSKDLQASVLKDISIKIIHQS